MSNIYHLEPPTKGKVVLHTSFGDVDVELWAREVRFIEEEEEEPMVWCAAASFSFSGGLRMPIMPTPAPTHTPTTTDARDLPQFRAAGAGGVLRRDALPPRGPELHAAGRGPHGHVSEAVDWTVDVL